mgnify:CR=1 FL=1
MTKLLKDIQNLEDNRGIDIQKVGVKDVEIPLIIQRKNESNQIVSAKARMSVDLPRNYKGTHMSRFMEVLNDWRSKDLLGVDIKGILKDFQKKLEAQSAHVKFNFKYFIKGLLDIDIIDYVQYQEFQDFDLLCEQIKQKKLSYPLIVKPSRLGSSIGISSATMAKLAKNEEVAMSTIQSLCVFLIANQVLFYHTFLFSTAAHFSIWKGLPCFASTFKRFSSVKPTRISWFASDR